MEENKDNEEIRDPEVKMTSDDYKNIYYQFISLEELKTSREYRSLKSRDKGFCLLYAAINDYFNLPRLEDIKLRKAGWDLVASYEATRIFEETENEILKIDSIEDKKVHIQKKIIDIKMESRRAHLDFKNNEFEENPEIELLNLLLQSLTLNNTSKEIEDYEKATPSIRGEQTLKLNLLHQFGIIDHLRKVWDLNNIKEAGMEILIAKIINENPESIRPRLAKKDDVKLRTDYANAKTDEFLEKFKLTIDKIKIN
ncbi:MAG: hypothetical protein IPK88_00035 [Saprospiraceae bacterium]|nr:hypothetical protein [Candidatus Defluviibacterium haderslevense]